MPAPLPPGAMGLQDTQITVDIGSHGSRQPSSCRTILTCDTFAPPPTGDPTGGGPESQENEPMTRIALLAAVWMVVSYFILPVS